MFTPYARDTAGALPWERFPAAAGSYAAGQLLNIVNGQLTAIGSASTTTPAYLCMAEVTVQAGALIPVVRVKHDTVFETTLSAAATSAKIGTKLQVAAGGLQANAAAEGSFEVVYLEDTAAGSTVRGRFA